MKLEDQVCSLSLSKRLKELGIKQESLFYYQNNPYNNGQDCIDLMINEGRSENNENVIINTESENDNHQKYSAFTASELGEMLPNYIVTMDPEPFNGFRIFIEKFISVEDNKKINNWIINYHCDTTEVYGKQEFFVKKLTDNIYDHNLANAFAKMLIYLIKKELQFV